MLTLSEKACTRIEIRTLIAENPYAKAAKGHPDDF